MGSSKDEQIIGFMYFLGVHAVLAQNKLALMSIKFAEKTAWKGEVRGGESAKVEKLELFGGEDAEGGVSGTIDVLDGDAAQGVNDYLSSKIDGVISAYRGVTSLVFRQFYFGNNPYLKRMAIKAADDEIWRQWYSVKAQLNGGSEKRSAEIYIAIDNSDSMVGARRVHISLQVQDFLEGLKGSRHSVMIVRFAGSVVDHTTIRNCSDADYDTLIAWVLSLAPLAFGTDFDAGVSLSVPFFLEGTLGKVGDGALLAVASDLGLATGDETPRSVWFFSDGQADAGTATAAATTLAKTLGLDVWCFRLDLTDISHLELLDNTPSDGVPNAQTGAGINFETLGEGMASTFSTWHDLNAAHIIRDAYVYANGGDDSIIGDTFTAVADTCYSEKMGLSFFWKNTLTHEEFINSVKEHADLVTYADRTTGKIEIKAIRDDFTVGDLFTFDKSNVTKWHDNIGKPLQKDLPNQITVVYTKRRDGSDSSITVANIAAMQSMETPRVIPEKVEFKGITKNALAGKVVMRELSARTVPLMSGTIDVTYAPIDLNLGSVFIVNNPEFGINNLVVRLTAKSETGGMRSKISLTFIEDKFSTPAVAIVVPDPEVVDDKSALDSPYRLFSEVGYYSLVVSETKTVVDGNLNDDPDSGVVALSGSRPNQLHNSLNAITDAGAGWEIVGNSGFMPVSTLIDSLSGVGTLTFDIVNNDSLRQVFAGSLCLVGSEIMRVDAMVLSGEVVTITVGRGCLDTTPTWHNSGDAIMFYDGFTMSDPVIYTAGEVIKGKLLPKTSIGRLAVGDATLEQVTLDSRAIRPYPVGNLKIDGEFFHNGILDATVPVTWSHRDRTLQVTASVEDYEYASIGPETGVSYEVEIRAIVDADDMFARADFFEVEDFFTDGSDGVLIRTESAASNSTFDYGDNGPSDFFAPDDFFDPSITDFFAATPVDFFGVSDFFSRPDFFGVVGGEALRTQIKVIASRDGYENWTVASAQGKHLMAPNGFTLEAQ